jgi:putative nucleotidyltransferase with HDIG domain
MQEKSMADLIEERIDRGGIELPVFHRIALKIQSLLSKDDYNTKDIAKLIHQDQSLATHVLESANSSFYAGLSPAKTIHDAVVRLGAKSILNVVMIVTQKQTYDSRNKRYQRWTNPLWSHALGVGLGAKWLAMRLGLDKLAEESFLAGLLHDVGKLLIIKIIEELEEDTIVHRNLSDSVIDDVINLMHCEKGGRLMNHLNMPEVYAQIVSKHHDESLNGESVMMNLVNMSNLACKKAGIGLKHDPGIMLSTTPEAVNLMASDILLAELQVELEQKKIALNKAFGLH